MDFQTISQLARESVRQGKYLSIVYNGVERDTYPVSFRSGANGLRLYALCMLHPWKPIESFLITGISTAEVSVRDALVVPSFDVEFGSADDEVSE